MQFLRTTRAPHGLERGDVPGWVLITGMTVALVMLVWGVASDALRNLVTGFLSNISFGG
jgi:cbb3-type cytochrome oxidase subunit 1